MGLSEWDIATAIVLVFAAVEYIRAISTAEFVTHQTVMILSAIMWVLLAMVLQIFDFKDEFKLSRKKK